MNLTDVIMSLHSPWDNPYQGTDKRILFVCSAGILRSATAARVYAKKYNTRAAGSAPYALIPVNRDLLVWANEVVFMNKENYESVKLDYPWIDEINVTVLNIPDMYEHMSPKLLDELREQYEDF